MNNSITLESVAHDFDQWRNTRPKLGHFPDTLWVKTLQLIDNYPISQICRTLRVSNAQIKAKLQLKQKTVVEKTTSFVELSLPKAAPNSNFLEHSSRIELKRSDGASMIIDNLNERTLSTLLEQFMRGF